MKNTNQIKIGALALLVCAASQIANAQISINPPSLSNFKSTTGNASNAQVLTLTATGPSGAIVVSAPEGFEVSKNATTGFARSITLGTPGGSIQSVYKGGFATHTGSVWDKGSGSEFPNDSYFAAVTANGSVVASVQGSFENVAQNLTSNVLAIYSNAESFAALKSNGSVVTWGDILFGGNSTVVSALNLNGNWTVTEGESVAGKLSSNVTTISSSKYAYAALKENGSVVTWGRIVNGGNSTAVLKNEINDSWVLTEGPSLTGSLSSNVSAVYSNWGAFAALKKDGSVVTWGEFNKGGNASVTKDFYGSNNWTTTEVKSVAGQLTSGVSAIYSNSWAFAALKDNGSVVTWGDLESGGNSSVISDLDVSGNWTITERQSVASKLASNVETIYSNSWAFAALKNDGSVVTWGALYAGGNSSVVTFLDGAQNDTVIEESSVSNRLSNVISIYSNREAFAALKSNGSVVTWGDILFGGNSSVVVSSYLNGNQTIAQGASVASSLSSGVVAIYSNKNAFAALKENGSVVTWGDAAYGGNSTITLSTESGNSATYNSTITELSSVAGSLSSNVTAIYSNSKAFAALKKDGSVVAWGDISCGGNLTQYLSYHSTEGESVASQLSSSVIAIYSTEKSFSALKSDGSVVPWGDTMSSVEPSNIGASTSGLPAQIYVRLASAAQVSTVTGDLVISSLTTADDTGVEIDSIPLSGSFTGSSDASGNSAVGGGGGGAPSGGGPAQVQKSKKGGAKSSAKKSSGSASKKSAASKSSGAKKAGAKKVKKK
jgi:hypothetical protein